MSESASISVQIIQKRLEAEDVVSLWLRRTDGSALPPITAGAHIEIETAPNVLRQYSLCGTLEDGRIYEIAVLKEPASRGGSKAVHEQLQVGQIVKISAPRNHFPRVPTEGRSLLLAGGIGVTPIMAMAEDCAAHGAAFEMHYCGRTLRKMAYVQRLTTGAAKDHVHIHVDDGAPAQQLQLAQLLATRGAADHLYVCGPAGFIDAVLKAAANAGWPEDHVHREFFAAPVSEAEGDNKPFKLVLGNMGLTFTVPADKSIAQVLEDNGVFVPTSCSEGICGTCIVGVLEGDVDHRDFLMSDAEHAANSKLTTCCSRAKSDVLVLDL